MASRAYARRATIRGAANALRQTRPGSAAVALAIDRQLALLEGFDNEVPGETVEAALRTEAEAIYKLDRPQIWREKSGAPRTAFAAHTYNEAFRLLGAHPRLVEPLMQLFGEPIGQPPLVHHPAHLAVPAEGGAVAGGARIDLVAADRRQGGRIGERPRVPGQELAGGLGGLLLEDLRRPDDGRGGCGDLAGELPEEAAPARIGRLDGIVHDTSSDRVRRRGAAVSTG